MTALTIDQSPADTAERTTMPIVDIVIGPHYRHGLGKLRTLQLSIREHGLLRPVPVTADGRLIVGGRRLAACTNLGWTDIPVIVARDGNHAIELLRADQLDTLCAKPMGASELVALGVQIEEYERPNALHRRALAVGHHKLPEGMRYQTRDVAADVIGLPVGQYTLIRTVVLAASGIEVRPGGFERVPVDEALQAEAREALKLIDRIHAGEEIRVPGHRLRLSVSGVCKDFGNRKSEARAENQSNVDWFADAAVDSGTTDSATAEEYPAPRTARLDHRKALAAGVATLTGLCHGLASIGDIDPATTKAEAASFERDLAQASRTLRALHNKIKEYGHGIA